MKVFFRYPTTLICLAVWVLSASIGLGQVMLSPAFDESKQGDLVPASSDPIITIHASKQPDPVLRYRLWPAPEKRRQRAAMVAVTRSLLLVSQVPSAKKRSFLSQYEGWTSQPIDRLPIDDARSSYHPFETAIDVLRTGENWMGLEYDLGMEEMTTREKIGTLLPEFQEMRDLARLISLRARVAAAEQRWDDAVDDLRLGFRLSEIAGHSTNTLLGRLIGIAISELMFDTIEAMIQLPDCPSLYWALASVPADHLFEMHQAIEYESTWAYHIGSVAGLEEMPEETIGEAKALVRIKEVTDAFSTVFESMGSSPGEVSWQRMSTGVQVTMMVQPSRELLAESPDWKGRVKELSDAETVLRASDFELSRIRQRWLAWSLLPDDLWNDYQTQRFAASRVTADSVTLGGRLARTMLPSVLNAMNAGRMAKQTHHRLLTTEALRLHATRSGKMPETIEKLLPVPAWPDPVSNDSFIYVRRSESEAKLAGAEAAGTRADTTTTIKLKVTQ